MKTFSYYLERLLPFLIIQFLYEIMEIVSLLLMGNPPGEGNAAALFSLLNETSVSFIFSIFPYLLYLLILPREFHRGRRDKLVSLLLFALFCLVNALEELAEVLSKDNFHLLTYNLLTHPRQSFTALSAMPGFLPGLILALVVVAASVLAFRRKLIGPTPAPPAAQRLLVPFALSTCAFILLQAQVGIEAAYKAPELYQDGLFSLFGGIFALTAVPDLGQIYATPCLGIAAFLLLFLLINAALCRYIGRQAAPLPYLQRGWQSLCTRFGTFRLFLFGLLAAALLVRLASLGLYPLMDTTEARYGEMARKMIETGNWLQPQFDYGVPFWGKPPLSFQASALAMLLFGIHAFAARLAPFLATCGIGLLFYAWPFARQRGEQATASFIILITSAMGFVAAGAVMTDAFLALGTMLSMISFWRATQQANAARLWGYLFFVGLALGLLSKGPLALVLCGLPIFLWVVRYRRWKLVLQRLPWLSGGLLMLALSLPWYLAAEQATPGFLRYFLVGEHFERFVVKGWQGDLYGSGHARPIGTIWLYAVEMFLPWSLLVPFLWNRRPASPSALPDKEEDTERREAKESRCYLWLWGLSPLLFFTMARNILPAYTLPGIPAFCLLLAQSLWKRLPGQADTRPFIFLPAPILLIVTLFALGSGFSHIQYRCDRDMLRAWDGSSPLYYANEKVTYSGQFYSAGKAKTLPTGTPLDSLPHGSYLAVPDASPHAATLPRNTQWRAISTGHKWKLYCKQPAPPTPHT